MCGTLWTSLKSNNITSHSTFHMDFLMVIFYHDLICTLMSAVVSHGTLLHLFLKLMRMFISCADSISGYKIRVIIIATSISAAFLIVILLVSIYLIRRSKQNLRYLMRSKNFFKPFVMTSDNQCRPLQRPTRMLICLLLLYVNTRCARYLLNLWSFPRI